MKRTIKYFFLSVLLVGFAQVYATEDSSKMSKTELDAAFISAVKKGQSEEVQELIQAGANIYTPIAYTVTAGDCDWRVESTPFMYAVKQNKPEMVKLLLSGERELSEALDVAIREGYAEVVEELIAGGADVNYASENGDTPLILAVQYGRATAEFSLQAQEKYRSRWSERRAIIQALLKSGANAALANSSGRTALMEAINEHDLHTVQSLLQARGDSSINAADQEGNTALILAVKKVRYSYTDNQGYNICMNSQNILKTLFETPGIDPYYVDNRGETAITLLEKLNSEISGNPY